MSRDREFILGKHIYKSVSDRGENILTFYGSDKESLSDLVKANLLQMSGSFVVVDENGELYKATAGILSENGYDIEVFNLNSLSGKKVCNIPDIGIKKLAVFCIVDDVNTIYNTVTGLLLLQIAEQFYYKADSNNGSLDIPVTFFLIDMITGFIPLEYFATSRSRNINFFIAVRDMKQLNHMYGEEQAQDILYLCDNAIFFDRKTYVSKSDSQSLYSNAQFLNLYWGKNDCFICNVNNCFEIIKDKKYKIDKHPLYSQMIKAECCSDSEGGTV